MAFIFFVSMRKDVILIDVFESTGMKTEQGRINVWINVIAWSINGTVICEPVAIYIKNCSGKCLFVFFSLFCYCFLGIYF